MMTMTTARPAHSTLAIILATAAVVAASAFAMFGLTVGGSPGLGLAASTVITIGGLHAVHDWAEEVEQ